MKIQDVFEIAFHKATQVIDPEMLVLDENEYPTKLLTQFQMRYRNIVTPVMESFIIEGRRGLIVPEMNTGRAIILMERIPGNRNSVVAYMRFIDTHAKTIGYANRPIVKVPLSFAGRKASLEQNRNLKRVMESLRVHTYRM
ncbi:hypothetical protein [Stenotrophomonas sp. GD03657]|uniref:hypothetical protein n=1 Tax=Stenotrophomonas sp. GD03657 TaxID=2975363 RepID=UPI0024491E35|nr:hypothetical protein [Stenotrophomonas sp. GD03657]MDH2154289.1 hypothetical protein [Stenotrophomonas sp. GD03657]